MRIAVIHLRTLLGAVLAIVLTNWIAETSGARWRNTSSREQGYEIFATYAEEARAPDVVFVGSSLTRWAVVPRALEQQLAAALGREVEIWNSGLHGATAPQLRYVVDRLLTERPPRLLVIEAAPAFWNEARTDASMLHYWRWFAPFHEALLALPSQPFDRSTEGLARAVWGMRALWRQGAGLLDPEVAERWDGLREKCRATRGSFWSDGDFARDAARGGRISREAWQAMLARRPERAALIDPLTTGEGWAGHLEHVLRRCREEGVRVAFLNPPIREELFDAYGAPDAKGLDGQGRHLRWMVATGAADAAELLDFRTLAGLTPAHYYNLDHLGPSGALLHSRALGNRLVPLLAAAGRAGE